MFDPYSANSSFYLAGFISPRTSFDLIKADLSRWIGDPEYVTRMSGAGGGTRSDGRPYPYMCRYYFPGLRKTFVPASQLWTDQMWIVLL